jgi:hypothetical protein
MVLTPDATLYFQMEQLKMLWSLQPKKQVWRCRLPWRTKQSTQCSFREQALMMWSL